MVPKVREAIRTASLIALAVYVFSIASSASTTADQAALDQLRSCIRANINSAIVTGSAAESPQFTKVAHKLYPILDCKRTQLSGTAVPLSSQESSKYIAVVFSARFPIIKDGKVIGSRDSLLEGVKSVEDAGKK